MGRDKYKFRASSEEVSDDSGSEKESSDKFDMKSYRRLLAEIFPSKYMSEKASGSGGQKPKKTDSPKKKEKSEEVKTDKKDKKKKAVVKDKKSKSSRDGKKRKNHRDSSSSEDIMVSDDTIDSEDSFSEESSSEDNGSKRKRKSVNIILTVGGRTDMMDESDFSDSEDDYDWSDGSEYSTLYSSDMDVSEDSEEETRPKTRRSKKGSKKREETNTSSDSESSSDDSVDRELVTKYKTLVDELAKKHKNSKLLKSLSKDAATRERKMTKGVRKREKKQKAKHTTAFKKLLAEKNPMGDVRFFKNKLSIEEQKKILEEITSVKALINVEKPYRLKLLDADIPQKFKACALKKLNTLEYMEPGEGEYYKLKNWIDTFMRIPFNIYSTLPLTLSDGVDKCHDFMEKAQKELDNAVFGLNDAKMQIMQMVGQWIANPKAIGTAIAIHGPMGTGKTTLVRQGISKILGREFAFIALGGATDSSFLEGHSYTYEGSTFGKIVDILLQCKTMNPVIYFDELDKISDSPKGEEIAGILTHLTDNSQNTEFHDKYFSEIDFDLSKALFIFSYNDESKVNPILRDRMYRITTQGYKKSEKVEIAKTHLLPSIRQQCAFNEDEVIIPTETLEYIIETFTGNEEGVRNLKRCLEIIHTKVNLFRLMRSGTNLFEGEISLKVTFPFTVTKELCGKLLRRDETDSSPPAGMYI